MTNPFTDYTVVLKKDEEGDVVVMVHELPGFTTHGADAVQALANLQHMLDLWYEMDAEVGEERIPAESFDDAWNWVRPRKEKQNG